MEQLEEIFERANLEFTRGCAAFKRGDVEEFKACRARHRELAELHRALHERLDATVH